METNTTLVMNPENKKKSFWSSVLDFCAEYWARTRIYSVYTVGYSSNGKRYRRRYVRYVTRLK